KPLTDNVRSGRRLAGHDRNLVVGQPCRWLGPDGSLARIARNQHGQPPEYEETQDTSWGTRDGNAAKDGSHGGGSHSVFGRGASRGRDGCVSAHRPRRPPWSS